MDWYSKIKRSNFTWKVVTFLLIGVAYIRNAYHIFRNKDLGYLTYSKTHTNHHQLKSFIKWCQLRPLQPIPYPLTHKKINVSIIIPVYNQWQMTCACINSILESLTDDINCEIILADDCSTDETVNASIAFPGLIVVKTEKNLGYLRNCNNAAKRARGSYILLLNNDTIVLPSWLTDLYNTIESDNNIAIVGPKILAPDGKIQEAGAILFSNGEGFHVGRNSYRYEPILNVQRHVDYISGCSILIRKSFWDHMGGFDNRYQNAYYEDADLAMSAHALGMSVIYQPKSEIIHFEHGSYSNKFLTFLNINKKIFVEKWFSALKKHSAYNNDPDEYLTYLTSTLINYDKYNRRFKKQLNILFYSQSPTYPLNHGNRTRMRKLIEKFEEMGHKVHFAMLETYDCSDKTLQGMRNQYKTLDIISCQKILFSFGKVPFDGWYCKGIGEHISLLCKRYDIDIVLSSYVFQSKLLEFVPPHILKVIDTHDKMGNRYEMMRSNKLPQFQFSCSPEEEGAYLRRADLIIGITDDETRYFKTISGGIDTLTISHLEKPRFLQKHFKSLRHVGIVASSNVFNVAMVQKCLKIIDKHYHNKSNPPFVVHIAGGIKNAVAFRAFNPEMRIFKRSWVKLHGFASDIEEFYSGMDLILSPMMCGTGINIKTVEAMAYGMPILTTIHGARGINLDDDMHNHEDIDALVKSLFQINENAGTELLRLAELSKTKFMQFHEKNEADCKLLFNHSKLRTQPHSDNVADMNLTPGLLAEITTKNFIMQVDRDLQ